MQKTFGKWQIQHELGKGGQGTVYLVKPTDTSRDEVATRLFELIFAAAHNSDRSSAKLLYDLIAGVVDNAQNPTFGALKVLHAFQDPADEEKAIGRLKSELDTLASISHPALIRVLDAEPSEKWFVTEFFGKGDLTSSLLETRDNIEATLLRLKPVVHAVSMLHEKDLVHRDIKPENTFVREDGSLVLGDCGLAIDIEGKRERLTATYENVGTRAWMPGWAMESRLEDVRPTFDVFSLGKMLWAMLIGKPRLPLWYHDRADLNPVQIFKEDASMSWAKLLLEKTVVQDERDCLPDARALLDEMDRALHRLRVGAQHLGDNRQRPCLVCGLGTYQLKWDRPRDSRVGMLVQQSKLFFCDYCGHVQLFYIPQGTTRKAWAQ